MEKKEEWQWLMSKEEDGVKNQGKRGSTLYVFKKKIVLCKSKKRKTKNMGKQKKSNYGILSIIIVRHLIMFQVILNNKLYVTNLIIYMPISLYYSINIISFILKNMYDK